MPSFWGLEQRSMFVPRSAPHWGSDVRPTRPDSSLATGKWVQRMSRTILVPFLVATIGATLGRTIAVAESPESVLMATPAAANPADCRVRPRPIDDFVALADGPPGFHLSVMQGTPAASPVVPPGGTAADPAVVTAVTATVNELAACINAGDLRRVAALYTDPAFAWFFRGPQETFDDLDREEFVASAATPMPLPTEQWARVSSVEAVTVLPSGQVTARVEGFGGEGVTFFRLAGDRYLFDIADNEAGVGTPIP